MKNFNLHFNAVVIEKTGQEFKVSKKQSSIDTFKKKDVIIKVYYSCLNYKDVLLAQGNPGLVRSYPHIPGIDLCGIVEYSKSSKFNPGDYVIVIARPLGVEISGGLAEYVKVPEKWVETLPSGLTLKEVIIFGTAGFTAALSIYNYEKFKKNNKQNNILVVGSTGGVGLLSVYMLANKGYEVVALTTKKNKKNLLKKLGAKEIIINDPKIKKSYFPLLRQKFSGVIETVGLKDIGNSIGQVFNGGVVVLVGMITSNKLEISLLPFILRGVSLVGINAEQTNNVLRKKIWKEIIKFKTKEIPENIYKEINMDNVSSSITSLELNKHFGRIIVNIRNDLDNEK